MKCRVIPVIREEETRPIFFCIYPKQTHPGIRVAPHTGPDCAMTTVDPFSGAHGCVCWNSPFRSLLIGLPIDHSEHFSPCHQLRNFLRLDNHGMKPYETGVPGVAAIETKAPVTQQCSQLKSQKWRCALTFYSTFR